MKCHIYGANLKDMVTDLPFKVSDRTIVILKSMPVGLAQENRITVKKTLVGIAECMNKALVPGRWYLLHLSLAVRFPLTN
jgi:hypothetical protein